MKHCTDTLRRLLSPYYAVLNVNSSVLLDEPWASYTSLLVFPGGADLQFCREFDGRGNQLITQYVRRGGRYLGFCAGGYYGSGRVEFEVGNKELEVSGPRELSFFPGTARGAVFKGFEYENLTNGKAASINVNKDSLGFLNSSFKSPLFLYSNGGCLFVDAEKYKSKGVEVLARYADKLEVNGSKEDSGIDAANPAAAVYCKVGRGSAILTGVHPEFSPDLLKRVPSDAKYTDCLEKLIAAQTERMDFMRGLLKKMGLRVDESEVPIPGLSRLSLSAVNPLELEKLLQILKTEIGSEDGTVLKGHNDAFRLWDSRDAVFAENQKNLESERVITDLDKVVKNVDVYYGGYPDNKISSSFDHDLYYKSLKNYREDQREAAEDIGTFLLYGEVVTSTSTLLYKNFNLLRHLPNGFSAVGTVQISGRGRGNNVWVNPPGVLATSTVLRLPVHDRHGLPSPMIFTQYIVSLAMVEAIRSYGSGYENFPIRLKWPNDIYSENPDFKKPFVGQTQDEEIIEFYKVGGLLVNSSILDNEYALVAGMGVNVSNHAPSISLNTIVNKLNEGKRKQEELPPLEHFTIEKLLAKYYTVLGEMLVKFKYFGFGPYEELYYKRWLHTDKIVTLEQYSNVKAKIKGISKDFGMLVVEEVDRNDQPTGKTYELQPDGNSFDMMKGLLKKKT